MKRKTFLAIALMIGLLLVIRVCNPPKKELNEIFEFKLGMTEKELQKAINSRVLEKIEKSSLKDRYDDELIRERVKAYYIKDYISEDNYKIEDIEVYFFDNKLYRILIMKYNTKVEDWLTQKEAGILNKEYEKPKKENKNSDLEEYGCWNGEKRKVSATSTTTDWGTNNKDIKCQSRLLQSSNHSVINYSLILVDNTIEWMANYGELNEKEKIYKKQKKLQIQREIDKNLLDRL